MNYLADSTAKLCQGGKGRYVGREGIPVDNCSSGSSVASALVSGASGPKFDPRSRRGKIQSPNRLSLVSLQG